MLVTAHNAEIGPFHFSFWYLGSRQCSSRDVKSWCEKVWQSGLKCVISRSHETLAVKVVGPFSIFSILICVSINALISALSSCIFYFKQACLLHYMISLCIHFKLCRSICKSNIDVPFVLPNSGAGPGVFIELSGRRLSPFQCTRWQPLFGYSFQDCLRQSSCWL